MGLEANTAIILGMGSVNERRRYKVTFSFFAWVHTRMISETYMSVNLEKVILLNIVVLSLSRKHKINIKLHYNDVIMGAIASQITSLTRIPFIQTQIKAPRHRPLGTGEFPAQMASNAENVSIWWRHHDGPKPTVVVSAGMLYLL